MILTFTSLRWWFEETDEQIKYNLETYQGHPVETPHFDLLRLAWSSVADLAIAPMQDLLGLDGDHRMNLPGTARGNWGWRCSWEQVAPDLADRVRRRVEMYGRLA